MMLPGRCLVFSVGTSERVFMMLPRESLVFLSCKTVEHRSRKSRDLLQTGEFTVSFQCSCMRTVHVCSFVSHSSISAHGSGCALSFFLDAVSKKHSILARSVFLLHGHRLCRDIAFVLIASIAIWIPDIVLYVHRETGNWRFTESEIRGIPYHW